MMDPIRDDMIRTLAREELGAPQGFAKRVHVDGNLKEAMEQMELAGEIEYVREEDGYEVWMEPYGVVACLTPWNYPLGRSHPK